MLTQVDNGHHVVLRGQQTLVVQLEAQPATGFIWELVALDATLVRTFGPAEFHAAPKLGASSIQTLRFQAIAAGETILRLHYGRSPQRYV
ncbi:protease inhibitor I42 family protein [Candidatus Viridilinea mediisalina]|nr:protease inhibitor I42 family protein [Candidatus Viridilinea mediisalina]